MRSTNKERWFWIYHKNIFRAIIVISVSMFACICVGWMDFTMIQNDKASDKVLRVQAQEKFELSLGAVVDTGQEEEADIRIKWWQENDTYYLFVSKYFSKDKLYWLFTGTDEIYIDGEQITLGEVCRVEPGSHTITLPSGESYQLEVMTASPIASIFIETDSETLDYLHADKGNEEGGCYTLFNEGGVYAASGRIENMHCRGNASWEDTDKKSYQLKLEKKTDLLGMGKDKHWILLANAFDQTLLRNATALKMAKSLQLAFTPETEFIDVYINGNYVGNYLLTEKVEIGTNRVAIRNLEEETELLNEGMDLSTAEFFMKEQGRLFSTKGYLIEAEPEDISGGYLLEIEMSDRYGLEASGFLTSRMQAVVFKSPTYASQAQVAYIANRYQDFEDAVFSEDGYSPYTDIYYAEYIDLDSFARKYLIEEVTKNLDAAFTSQFFYKPDDRVSTKFFAGPAWDYDKAIAGSGITNEGIDLHDSQGLYAAVQTKESDIWYGLYGQADFRQRAAEIFMQEMKPMLLSQTLVELEQNTELMMDSAMMNSVRWNTFSDCHTLEDKQEQYREKVQELKDFLKERAEYLEDLWMEELLDE